MKPVATSVKASPVSTEESSEGQIRKSTVASRHTERGIPYGCAEDLSQPTQLLYWAGIELNECHVARKEKGRIRAWWTYFTQIRIAYPQPCCWEGDNRIMGISVVGRRELQEGKRRLMENFKCEGVNTSNVQPYPRRWWIAYKSPFARKARDCPRLGMPELSSTIFPRTLVIFDAQFLPRKEKRSTIKLESSLKFRAEGEALSTIDNLSL